MSTVQSTGMAHTTSSQADVAELVTLARPVGRLASVVGILSVFGLALQMGARLDSARTRREREEALARWNDTTLR